MHKYTTTRYKSHLTEVIWNIHWISQSTLFRVCSNDYTVACLYVCADSTRKTQVEYTANARRRFFAFDFPSTWLFSNRKRSHTTRICSYLLFRNLSFLFYWTFIYAVDTFRYALVFDLLWLSTYLQSSIWMSFYVETENRKSINECIPGKL